MCAQLLWMAWWTISIEIYVSLKIVASILIDFSFLLLQTRNEKLCFIIVVTSWKLCTFSFVCLCLWLCVFLSLYRCVNVCLYVCDCDALCQVPDSKVCTRIRVVFISKYRDKWKSSAQSQFITRTTHICFFRPLFLSFCHVSSQPVPLL